MNEDYGNKEIVPHMLDVLVILRSKIMTTQDYIFIGFLILVLVFPLVKKWYIQANSRLGRYSRFTTEVPELELRKLFWMSKDKLKKEPTSDRNDQVVDLKRVIELSEKLQAYCSLNILIDFSNKKLQHRDFITIYRRMDFVTPDKFHVTQDAWDAELGEVDDEWISIGDKNYQNVLFWMPTDDGFNADVNKVLKMDKYFEILRHNKPIKQEVFTIEKDLYSILEYQPPLHGLSDDTFPECPNNLSCQIYLWINLDSGFFIKGEIVFKEKDDIVAKYIDVYSCYNENITIEAPVLNTTLDENDELTLKNTNTITVPHHS